jgi:hypothetical protein
VDAVGAHQQVGLDVVAVIGQPDQAVVQVDALGRERAGQRRQQVGSVHLVMGEAEGGLEWLRRGRAQQRAAVVPAALVPRQRLDAGPGQLPGEPEPVEVVTSVGFRSSVLVERM